MDRDASRAGLSFSGRTSSAGVTWQPKQYVLTKNTFFSTIADPLVGELITITDSSPVSPFYLPSVLFPSCSSSFLLMFLFVPILDVLRNAVC